VKWSRADALPIAALAAGIALFSLQRARLVNAEAGLKLKHDVYLLPPKAQAVAMSLGYRAALADFIYGHVLVSVGVHLSEKRHFEFAAAYLETVNELDPKFRDPYRYADAIITLQTVAVPEEAFHQARAILLRGTREHPYDQELWSAAGGFLAYLAPTNLRDPRDAEAFRQDGARLLARACELIGSNENIPYQCITAARLFGDAGNRAASQAFLEKLLVVSDNPEIRALAGGQLAAMGIQQHAQQFEKAWRDDLPFVSRNAQAAVGPRFDAAACAGRHAYAGDACTTSFRDRATPANP